MTQFGSSFVLGQSMWLQLKLHVFWWWSGQIQALAEEADWAEGSAVLSPTGKAAARHKHEINKDENKETEVKSQIPQGLL